MIPHDIIMKRIGKTIGDPRVLEILRKFLSAGFIDSNNILNKPKLGTPQGGFLSPLLANIVLHEFDEYLAEEKKRFDKGTKRRKNPVYAKLQALKGKTKDMVLRRKLLLEMRRTRRSDAFDPNYRRIKYIRYADYFVIFIAGPQEEANWIRAKVKDVLKAKCGLELNLEKTTINNMVEKWNFLGAEIRGLKANETWLVRHSSGGRATGIARTIVNAPIRTIIDKLKKAKLVRQNNSGVVLPMGYTPLMNLSHQEILTFYNSKIRGLVNFYSFAANKPRLYYIL